MATLFDEKLQRFLPVGTIIEYAGGTVPRGFLLCDGSAVSRKAFSKLFIAIGTVWGVGDGVNTFNLPDCRRRVSVGSGGVGTGTLGNTLASLGGAETHQLVTGEIPAHSHTYTRPDVSATATIGLDSGVMGVTGAVATGNAGGGGAHNNVQPSMIVNKLIQA